MSSSANRPVPAVRRVYADRSNGTSSGNPSSGLLINVIRTLTSSVSEDQRELEKTRLEKGFKESEALIDRLVKHHQSDVEECLDAFRGVSTKISATRERIHNVRNALQTCKALLENRRDDLRKLWLENAQQKYICEIMASLEQLRDAPLQVEALIARNNFQEAAKIISNSRELLDGRFNSIDGLYQLRAGLKDASNLLSSKIIESISELLVVQPFEKHMIAMIRDMPEQKMLESELCKRLSQKAKQAVPEESFATRLSSSLTALAELKGGSMELERVLDLAGAQIEKQIANSISVIRAKASISEQIAGDQTHLSQLIQMVVAQLDSSHTMHQMLAEIAATSSTSRGTSVVPSFWISAQSAVETLVSDHLDINPLSRHESMETKKQLFRMDAAAFAAGTSAANPSTQHQLVVCQPSPFNMVVIFPWLQKLMEKIEKVLSQSQCQLRRFVHSFVMELFIERVKDGLQEKMDAVKLSGLGTKSRIALTNEKVLPSCEQVLQLCREVNGFITSMDPYADRLAALWLLLLTEYLQHVTLCYEKTSMPLSENDISARKKISAAWTADEDISRLLMSLPNWQTAAMAVDSDTPSTPMAESEKDIRARNERESDILIGNLATQKKIERAELLTDMQDVRALALLHQSLRYFAAEVRKMLSSFPNHIKMMLKNCMVTVQMKEGHVSKNEPVLNAMEECVKRIEAISFSCLLMLHLELRVHCFFHLLPLARLRNANMHDEIDPEVLDLGRDLQAFHELLSAILSKPKLDYVFDGLGHLCASIFIHSSQHMPRLSEWGKKRVCRNMWGVQQRLSQLTGRREAELDRARAFFELLSHDPDRLLTLIPDHRSQFTNIELNHLVALSVRSHPSLANQHGALEQRLQQLATILQQRRK